MPLYKSMKILRQIELPNIARKVSTDRETAADEHLLDFKESAGVIRSKISDLSETTNVCPYNVVGDKFIDWGMVTRDEKRHAMKKQVLESF